ncbi:ABC transporter permease, partial [Ruminococcus callidus]
MKTQKVKQILLGLIVPVLILAAWICATHFGNIPTSILPKISMVWQAFLEMLQSGQLWNDLSVTLSRVLKGYLLSAVLGTVLGSLMGMSKTVLH